MTAKGNAIHWGRLLLAMFVGVMIARAAEVVTLDRRDPIKEWISAEVTNHPVPYGRDVVVKMCRVKVRDDCLVSTDRSFTSEVTGRTWPVDDAYRQPSGSPKVDCVVNAWRMPGYMPPGPYTGSVRLIYSCPGGVAFVHEPPAFHFSIEPR